MGWLLLLSVPVFYILGLVAFIRWLTGLSRKGVEINRREYLEKSVEELTQVVKTTPNKTLVGQLVEYTKELNTLKLESTAASEISKPAPISPELKPAVTGRPRILSDEIAGSKPSPTLQEDWSRIWENWYSDNSINLLLYLGSFLIVASATIYVGFQWATLGGVMKAAFFSLLSLAFFGFGVWFYNVPKIKTAGATFIAIAALLIPFNGLAWHNFVYGPAGYSIGSTWLVTSLIAVIAYAFFAFFIRHPFYTYIAGFGGLSLVLSTVNVMSLDREFYILGGIFSSFVLLLSTRIFGQNDKDIIKNYTLPLSITAHIIMPVSLAWGLIIATADNQLFTFEAVTSAFLATLYYLVAFSFAREISYLFISLFLLPFSLFLAGKYIDIEATIIFIFIQILSILYLLVVYVTNKNWKKESEAILLIANIIMPIAAIAGILTNLTDPKIYTIEKILIGLTATLFYLISYFIKKEVTFVAAAQIIIPFTAFATFKWLGLTTLQSFYLLQVILACYLIISFIIRKIKVEESQTLIITALSFAAGLFLLTFPCEFSAFHQTFFAAIPAVFGLSAVYVSENYSYLYYNFAFITIGVYLYFNELLGLRDKLYVLGLAYLVLTVIFYLIALLTTNRKEAFQAFINATIFNAFLGSIFTIYEPKYFLVGNLIAATLALDAAQRFKKFELIYLSNAFIYVGLWSTLRIFDTKIVYYPLFFAGLSYLFYGVSASLPKNIGRLYRFTSMIGIGVNTAVFGLFGHNEAASSSYSPNYYSTPSASVSSELERNALISSYAATLLYGFDAALIKKAAFGYFASAVAMTTYLWQVNYLNITETQIYTLPLGIYFMVLAYLQRIGGKLSTRNLLDYIGLFFLLIPTFFQSLGADGAKYALLLGLEGLGLFGLGTSLSYRTYIYTGIAAVAVAIFSQTYEFLFSLPRWIITAVAGLILLSTAIYLLLNRKEEK